MHRTRAFILVAGLLLLAACTGAPAASPPTGTATPRPAAVAPLPTLRPAGSCHLAGALPDAACTPGAIQGGVTAAMICAPGYTTRTVRPPASYTDALKRQQIAEYGYQETDPTKYEEDHLIPLELAGNPTAPANLWPQPRAAHPGASEKDATENAAHKAVCAGRMTLPEAQDAIAHDWTALRDLLATRGLLTLGNPGEPVPTEP